MKAINTMSLTFDSLSQNESFARSATAGFFTQLNPTVEELCDIRTAVSEAVTNSIVHGYRKTPGKVKLTARIFPGRKISITVKDSGCGIENIEQAIERAGTKAGNKGYDCALSAIEMINLMKQI